MADKIILNDSEKAEVILRIKKQLSQLSEGVEKGILDPNKVETGLNCLIIGGCGCGCQNSK